MAIKGKGRTRGRRIVAAPPRPQLVVRKPPLWRRRWFLALLAVVVLAGIGTGVLIALSRSRARDLREREIVGVESFTAALVRRLPKDARTVPPDVPQLFPDLAADVDKVAAGELQGEKAKARGAAVSSSAGGAATAVEAMRVNRTIAADFTVTDQAGAETAGATRRALSNAQFLMAHGLRMYQQAGALLSAAATSPQAAKGLAQSATALLTEARVLFDRGYRTLLQIRAALGLPPPQVGEPPPPPPTAPGGLPGG